MIALPLRCGEAFFFRLVNVIAATHYNLSICEIRCILRIDEYANTADRPPDSAQVHGKGHGGAFPDSQR